VLTTSGAATITRALIGEGGFGSNRIFEIRHLCLLGGLAHHPLLGQFRLETRDLLLRLSCEGGDSSLHQLWLDTNFGPEREVTRAVR
jgi:hypothetical protein